MISEDCILCKTIKIEPKFQKWFDAKLKVGGFPSNYNSFDINRYDYIINVSDEYIPYRPNNTFWFPMNECKRDIGLNSIYGALCILNIAFNKNLSVYLHCAAGANRSPTVRAAFYFMKTGKHIIEDYGLLDVKLGITDPFDNQLIRNCYYGYLPTISEMENFLMMLNKDLEDKTFHANLDTLKLKTLK